MFMLPTKAQKQAKKKKKCKGIIVICKRRQRFATYFKGQCCDPPVYACQRPHTGFLLAMTINYHYVCLDHYESQWVEQHSMKLRLLQSSIFLVPTLKWKPYKGLK